MHLVIVTFDIKLSEKLMCLLWHH